MTDQQLVREREQTEVLQVRMTLNLKTAERIADLMPQMDAQLCQRVKDQLWLRTVFVEQLQLTCVGERDLFEQRCDRILALLDPTDEQRDPLTHDERQLLIALDGMHFDRVEGTPEGCARALRMDVPQVVMLARGLQRAAYVDVLTGPFGMCYRLTECGADYVASLARSAIVGSQPQPSQVADVVSGILTDLGHDPGDAGTREIVARRLAGAER